MKLITIVNHSMKASLQFIMEAVAEVFSLDHDNYPATGIQPFSGEMHHHR